MATAAAASTNPSTVSQPTPQLHFYIKEDPVVDAKSHARWKNVWTVAAIAATVACVALATLAVVFVSIYAPVHLPLTLILLTIPGLPLSVSGIDRLWDKATRHEQDLKRDRWLIEKMKEINDPAAECKKLSVVPGKDLSPEQIKKLLALYYYEKDGQIKNHEKATQYFNPKIEITLKGKVHKVKPENYKPEKVNFEDETERSLFRLLLNHKRLHNLCHQTAACLNVSAAKVLKVIENPYEPKVGKNYIYLFDYNGDIRRAAGNNDPVDIMLTMKGRNYSYAEISQKDTHQLSKEMFGLQSNKPWL